MKKIFKKLCLFMIFGFLVIALPPSGNVVLAEYDGTYYIADFSDYSVGDQYINFTDNGVFWASMIPYDYDATYPSVDDKEHPHYSMLYKFSDTSDTRGNAFFNLTSQADYLQFWSYLGTTTPTKVTENISFYSDGDLVFYMFIQDDSAGGSEWDVIVYDDDGVLIVNDLVTDSSMHTTNVTVNSTTNEINIQIDNTTIDTWFSVDVSSIDSVRFNQNTANSQLRFFVIDNIKVELTGESPPPSDFDIWVIPQKDQYYTGSWVDVYTKIPQDYPGQFHISMKDADGTGVYINNWYTLYYPVPKGENILSVFLPNKNQWGINYDMGSWTVRCTDGIDYDYITTHDFNVTTGTDASVAVLGKEFLRGEKVEYEINNGNTSFSYNLTAKHILGEWALSQNIITDVNGFYEGWIPTGTNSDQLNIGTYRLYLYDNTTEINSSKVFHVVGHGFINQYMISSLKSRYDPDGHVDFNVWRVTGQEPYTIAIYDDNDTLLWEQHRDVNVSEMDWQHKTSVHGTGTYHLYVYDQGESRFDSNAEYKFFRVATSDLTDQEGLYFFLGIALVLGISTFIAMKTDFMVFPFVAMTLTFLFSQNVYGYTLIPWALGVPMILLLALLSVVLWLLR